MCNADASNTNIICVGFSNFNHEYFVSIFVLVFKYLSFSFIPSVGTSFEPSITDYATRHRGHEPFYPVGSADGASQMQQGQLGFNEHHLYFSSSCHSQPHQLPQPPPSTIWPQFSQLSPVSYHQRHQSQHPPPSTYQPQFSQLQSHSGNIFIISAIFFLDGCYNFL